LTTRAIPEGFYDEAASQRDAISSVNEGKQGRIQEFWKGGPVRGQSPEPSAGGGLPRKF